jgi:prevent-host-death family protein
MKTTTVRALRNDYASLLRRVETGEEIAISRRGRIVARLVPAHPEAAGKTDWNASAARRVCRSDQPLTSSRSAQLIRDAQGNW